jgi:hypothetical protein
MGTHTSLGPLYAYAPIGERAFFEVPRNRGKNTTLLASLDRGDGSSVGGRGCRRRAGGILRPLRLPHPGAATRKGAVRRGIAAVAWLARACRIRMGSPSWASRNRQL